MGLTRGACMLRGTYVACMYMCAAGQFPPVDRSHGVRRRTAPNTATGVNRMVGVIRVLSHRQARWNGC
jgi:hypothetical protein